MGWYGMITFSAILWYGITRDGISHIFPVSTPSYGTLDHFHTRSRHWEHNSCILLDPCVSFKGVTFEDLWSKAGKIILTLKTQALLTQDYVIRSHRTPAKSG